MPEPTPREPLQHPGIQRVRDAAARKGVELDIRVFDESTHTAADASAALDAELGQIVKSLVFVAPAGDGSLEPILCLVSGPNRVDLARLAAVTGERDIRRATAREAQELTGFTIGGIPPFGHLRPYHGSFALHLAARSESVIALDASADALGRANANCVRNGFQNVQTVEADAFEFLRARQTAGDRFDTIVLDPPAFAKARSALPSAIRGYKEINLRAMRILKPGGLLFTASCSFHLSKALFLDMVQSAAADSGRRVVLRAVTGQPLDHPEVLTVPETGYLKGALLEVVE